MPVLLAAAAVAGPVIGGIMGSKAAQANRDAALKASQSAQDMINQIGAPPDLAKEIVLENYKQAGILTPELEQTVNEQFVKYAPENKNTVDAQQQSLQALQKLAQTGMRP